MTGKRRLKRDTLVNVISVVVRVVALMWVIHLAGVRFSPIALGLFLLSRRVASTLACLVQLGVSQTLLRFVGQYADDVGMKRIFVWIGILVWLVVAIMGILVAVAFGGPLSGLLFPGTPDNVPLARWTIGLLIATVASFLPYSVLLAERRVLAANVVELLNVSGFLLVIISWLGARATPPAVIAAHTIAMVVMSTGTLAWYLLRLPEVPRSGTDAWREASVLAARFGLPRGLSAFLDMLVLLIGPWMLRNDMEEAGYLIIALTLVRMLQSGVTPISQMGAIVVARRANAPDDERLREGVRLLAAGALYGTTLALACLVPWLGTLLALWLPAPGVAPGVETYATLLLVGAIPYVLFQTLKGVVEMRWVAPRNLLSLIAACGIQVTMAIALAPIAGRTTSAAVAIATSFAVLGVLTVMWLRAYLQPFGDFAVFRLAVVSAVLTFINVTLAKSGGPLEVTGAVLVSLAVVGVFVYVFPSRLLLSMRTFLLTNQ